MMVALIAPADRSTAGKERAPEGRGRGSSGAPGSITGMGARNRSANERPRSWSRRRPTVARLVLSYQPECTWLGASHVPGPVPLPFMMTVCTAGLATPGLAAPGVWMVGLRRRANQPTTTPAITAAPTATINGTRYPPRPRSRSNRVVALAPMRAAYPQSRALRSVILVVLSRLRCGRKSGRPAIRRDKPYWARRPPAAC
jgi:hypothetical protein